MPAFRYLKSIDKNGGTGTPKPLHVISKSRDMWPYSKILWIWLSKKDLSLIVKLETKDDDEEPVRIKETAILALGRLFKEIKDAKGKEN